MVQKFAEAAPSSIILDEPAEGFSKGQLGKVREILDEMAHFAFVKEYNGLRE
jgi:ABC-type branched-subunit amino acid transport system ATPase component